MIVTYLVRRKKKQVLEEPEVDWDIIEKKFDEVTEAQKMTETFRYSVTTPSSTVVARMSQVPDSTYTDTVIKPSNAKEASQVNITKPDISELVSTTNVNKEK